jgi:hypothetical protein
LLELPPEGKFPDTRHIRGTQKAQKKKRKKRKSIKTFPCAFSKAQGLPQNRRSAGAATFHQVGHLLD